MKTLPSGVVVTRRTAVYTHESMPAALAQSHRTTPGTWARIHVLSGRLRYRTLDAPRNEITLSPDRCGVIPPDERHQVEALGPVRFYLEFFRASEESEDSARASPARKRTQALRREHVNFHLLLDLLERELDMFTGAGRPDYALMEDIVRYMREYPDRLHHPWEDRIFERLAQADLRLAPVVAELKRQHEALARNGSALLESLEGAVSGVLLPREALERPGRDYIEAFRRHMALEETNLFPLFGSHLSDSDWNAIDQMMAARKDPLFGRDVADQYERLYRVIGEVSPRSGPAPASRSTADRAV